MKHTILALFLALTVTCWAQTATQASPAPAQSAAPGEKGKCPCCDKMAAADTKDAHSCCAHHANHSTEGNETASCCGGKDAKSCMRDSKNNAGCCKQGSCGDKTAASCSKDKCGKECKEGCCSQKMEKAAGNCCDRESRS